MNYINDVAEVASNWWSWWVNNAEKISRYNTLITSDYTSVNRDDLLQFKQALKDDITQKLYSLSDGDRILLNSTYLPCAVITSLANKYNIPLHRFPMNTVMWIYNNACTVKVGYIGITEYLYETSDYWEYQLKQNELILNNLQNEKYADETIDFIKEEIANNRQRINKCKNKESLI